MAFGLSMDNLCFAGMCAIVDPPRPGVREAIETVHGAGVDVKMITGDAMQTAVTVGWYS